MASASGGPDIGTQRPNVTVFEPDFGAPRSWRASLGVSHRMSARLGASLDFSYALGTNLYSVRDLNLNTAPQFVLGARGESARVRRPERDRADDGRH